MAKEIELKLDQLKFMCGRLGLNPTPTKVRLDKITGERYHELSKNDCILAIQEYYLNSYKSRGFSYTGLEYIRNLESPMLSLSLYKAGVDLENNIWTSDEYVAEEKLDGLRLFLTWFKEDNYVGAFKRGLSTATCLPEDIEIYRDIKLDLPNFVLDGELVPINKDYFGSAKDTMLSNFAIGPNYFKAYIKDNPIKLIVFDILMYDDKDLTQLPYEERVKYLSAIIDRLSPNLNIELVSKNNNISLQEFYNQILLNKGKGVMLKHKMSVYDSSGKRTTNWIKVKAKETTTDLSVSCRDIETNAFILGAEIGEDNLVSRIRFGAYIKTATSTEIQEPQEVALVGDLPDKLRQNITSTDVFGNISIRPELIGNVAVISSEGIDSNLKLINPKLVQWRLDITAKECIIVKI